MEKRGDKKQKEKISEELKQGNISLILDSYNDIFSSFDPRPYSEKALSDDFLTECKKASVDKREEGLELRLLVPAHRRNSEYEQQIRKRMKTHFQKHYKEKKNEVKKIRKEGVLWFLLGATLIFTATWLYTQEGFIYNMLFVLFEPAGWFTLWNGLDRIFILPREKGPELNFYKKMAKVKIYFYSY